MQASRRISAVAARFLRDTGGNFATIFAIALLPMAGLCGLAMDYANMRNAESRLQSAVDSGITAAASTRGTTAAMQQVVSDFIAVNMDGAPVEIDTVVDSHQIRVEARLMVAMPVMSAFGYPETEVSASATVTSQAPFSGGSVAHAPGMPAQGLDEAELRRRFDRAISRLPPRDQARLRRSFEHTLAQLRTTGMPIATAPFHLAR